MKNVFFAIAVFLSGHSAFSSELDNFFSSSFGQLNSLNLEMKNHFYRVACEAQVPKVSESFHISFDVSGGFHQVAFVKTREVHNLNQTTFEGRHFINQEIPNGRATTAQVTETKNGQFEIQATFSHRNLLTPEFQRLHAILELPQSASENSVRVKLLKLDNQDLSYFGSNCRLEK